MTVHAAIFYVLSGIVVVCTAMAITRRQPVHSILYLIAAFLGTAALFFQLGAPLLAAFVVIAYAGAMMVLFLFVIMLFHPLPREGGRLRHWGPAAFLGVVFLVIAVAMVFKDPGGRAILQSDGVQPRDFGYFLFDRYWLAIEIVSMLFLVVLVAIIQLRRSFLVSKSNGDPP